MKNALIIGGSKGLGWASAKKLASEGFRVFIVHRDPRFYEDEFQLKLAKLNSSDEIAVAYNLDALKADNITYVLSQINNYSPEIKIDVLIHSVAKGSLKSMQGENPLNSQDIAITLQAMGYNMYEWASAIKSQNLFTQNASIIGFTSEGNQKVWENYAAVSAAKASLEALMRHMAVSFAKDGIRTNLIQAGVCKTDAFKQIPGSEQIETYSLKRNPFNRLTTPEDVANVVYLLTRQEAKWINGSIIKVDGGESLK